MRTRAISLCLLGLVSWAPALTRAEDSLQLTSIQVEPSECVLDGKWSSQTLLALGRLSDGTLRDVTSAAEFKPASAGVVKVSGQGMVEPVSDGETTISVTAKLGDSAASADAQVVVKNASDASTSFLHHVMPLADRLGCNTAQCHGSQKGKGGLRLSLFAAEPEFDYAALTKAAGGRRVNKVEPSKSLFLLKATASIPHEGGQKVQPGTPQYEMLASWVAQGAPWTIENQPELVSIQVLPEERILRKGETQQLLVTAVFSDGTRKDVTPQAHYQSPEPTVATVGERGEVTAANHGQAAFIVSYMRRFCTARIVIPQPLPSPFPDIEPTNKIDELVFAKLKELGLPPSDLCSDHEFIRRVHLDVVGTLPTADQARAFLADADPQKRSQLIDRLLDSDEFAHYWAMKWGDLLRIKSEYPSNLWPNAVQAYHRWIRDSIAKNKPYDQFARELLTASGSNFRSPPANYYRALLKREPQSLAEVTALVFLGGRVGCARCHAHPSESWTSDDNVALAAFFAQVQFKRTQEWKEEIVFVNPKRTMRHPRTNELVQPRFLDDTAFEPGGEEDLRVKFAEWLTSPDNSWFARAIVNRTWFWLLGRGIIHEVDDLRSTNPPQNPQLLEYLVAEFTSHGYDLKHVDRLILNSRTYQLSSKSNEFNANDVAHFSHYQVKRLGAETLLDAIGQVTERWDTYQSRIPEPFVRLPNGFRATHLADGSIGIPFLELFGRPPRDTAYESDRDLQLSMRQTLHVLNSSDVQNKINASPRLKRLMAEQKDNTKIIEEVYLSTLSRFPTEEESKRISDYLSGKDKPPPQQAQDAKKAAEEALANVKNQVAAATEAHQAADKTATEAAAAAKEAETAAAKADTNSDSETGNGADPMDVPTDAATEAAKVAANVSAEKRKLADDAKAKLDKLAADEKAAIAKLAEANKTLNAAIAALKPPRNQALQDLLWAILNTKEFLFNH